MQRPIRKNSYLLLEVVCCLALVTLCLWPLLKPTLNLYISKQQMLIQLHDQRLEKIALGEVKEMLYAHKLPFATLQKETSFPLSIENSVCLVRLIPQKESSKPSLHRIGLLIEVKLDFKKVSGAHHEVSHFLFIEGVTR